MSNFFIEMKERSLLQTIKLHPLFYIITNISMPAFKSDWYAKCCRNIKTVFHWLIFCMNLQTRLYAETLSHSKWFTKGLKQQFPQTGNCYKVYFNVGRKKNMKFSLKYWMFCCFDYFCYGQCFPFPQRTAISILFTTNQLNVFAPNKQFQSIKFFFHASLRVI